MTTEAQQQQSEVRLFTVSPDGVPIHWLLTAKTSLPELHEIQGVVGELIEWLGANEFKGHEGFSNKPSTPATQSNAPPARQAARSAPQRQPARSNGNSRPAGAPQRVMNPDAPVTEGQEKALFAISRSELNWTSEDLEEYLDGRMPSELTRGEASRAIDDLKRMAAE